MKRTFLDDIDGREFQVFAHKDCCVCIGHVHFVGEGCFTLDKAEKIAHQIIDTVKVVRERRRRAQS